ncbi:hypothetical protein KQI84_09925 [bacterium]|nr:hypothetical protein [bacterium]
MNIHRMKKPELESPVWAWLVKGLVILGGLFLIGFLAYGLGSYLFRPRETSARNSCQETMTKIDSAVQQYLLEYNLEDQAEFVALFGTEQPDWSPVLVGKDLYIRYPPRCPLHKSPPFWKFWRWWEPSNDYSIATSADVASPVVCNASGGRHYYPTASGS